MQRIFFLVMLLFKLDIDDCCHARILLERQSFTPCHLVNATGTSVANNRFCMLKFTGGYLHQRLEVNSPLRYVAYGSEVAEALRPVAPESTITALYTMTYAYILMMIVVTYRLHIGSAVLQVMSAMLHELIFQVLANLLIPTSLVHFLVNQSTKSLGSSLPYLPVLIGVTAVIFLPLIDPVIERCILFLSRKTSNFFSK